MSTEINNQVVQMTFDNKQFEKGAADTMKTIDKLKVSLNFSGVKDGLKHISAQISTLPNLVANGVGSSVQNTFSHTWSITDQFIRKMTDSVMRNVHQMTSQLNVFKDSISGGFSEYETQIGAVQTIWANTKDDGKTLADITKVLDELNDYADKTIYNYSEMTKNIGTFTAAGVDLYESSDAIQGIANLAAMSGSTSTQASTAMYQLSQALAAGRVSLMDWNSVVNAGMGGKVFQKVLIETAREMGTISNELATGLENGTEVFRNTLTENGWITSEVLTEALTKFTDTSTELGRTATDAATKVKTFTQLIGKIKETIGSGWAQSWEYIIGDFESARELFTDISNAVENLLEPSITARNEMLAYWSGVNQKNKQSEEVLEEQTEHQKKIEALAKRVIAGDFGNVDSGRYDALSALGVDYREVQNAVNALYGMPPAFELIADSEEKAGKKSVEAITGREYAIMGLTNIANELVRVFNYIHGGIGEVFKPLSGEKLTELSKRFYELTESMRPSPESLKALRSVVTIVARLIKIGGKLGKSVVKGIKDALDTIVGEDTLTKFFNGIVDAGEAFRSFELELEKNGVWETISNGVSIAIKALANLPETIRRCYEAAKDYFAGLEGLKPTEALHKMFTDLSNSMTDLFTVAGQGENAAGPLGAFGEFAKSVLDFLASVGNAIGGSGAMAAAKINQVTTMLTKMWNALGLTEFIDIFNPIKLLNAFGKALHKILEDLTIEDIEALGLVLFFGELRKLIGSFGMLAKSLTNVTNSISSPLSRLIKTLEMNMRSLPQILMMLSVSMLSLAGSVWILSQIETDKALINAGIILGLMGALLGIAAIIKKMQKKVEGVEEVSYLPLIGTILSLVYAVQTLTLLAAGVSFISKYTDIWAGFGFITATLGFMLGVIVILQATTNSLGRFGSLTKTAGAFISLATALNFMMAPLITIAWLSTFDNLDFNSAVWVVHSMTGILGAILLITTYATSSGDILATSGAFILLGIALNAMLIPIYAISKLAGENPDIYYAIGMIGAVAAVMMGILSLATIFTGAGDILATGAAFILLGVALNIMAKSIGGLTELDGEKLKGAVKAIKGIAIALGALIGVLGILTIVLQAFGFGWLVPVLIGSLALLVVSFAALGFAISKVLDSLTNFSDGLIRFSDHDFKNFGRNITQILDGVATNSEKMGSTLSKVLIELAKAIKANAGDLAEAIGILFASLLVMFNKVLIEMSPVVVETVGLIVDLIAAVLVEAITTLGYWMLKGLLKGITLGLQAAGEEVPALIEALNFFLNEVGDALLANSSDIHSGCEKIMEGIGKCLFGEDFSGDWSDGFGIAIAAALAAVVVNPTSIVGAAAIALGASIASAITKGISADKATEKKLENSVAGNTDYWNNVNAIVGAPNSSGPQKFETWEDQLDRQYNGFTHAIGPQLPKYMKEAEKIGDNITAGVVKGVDNGEKDIVNAADRNANAVIGAYETTLDINSPSGEGIRIGRFLVEGIRVGMDSGVYSLRSSAIRMCNEIVRACKQTLDIHSPSKVGITIGNFFSKGVSEGVAEGTKETVNSATDMATALQDGVWDVIKETDFGKGIAEMFGSLTNMKDVLDGKSGKSLTDVLSDKLGFGDLGLETTITPVMDMSNVYSSVSDINSMFGSQSLGLSDLNSSLNTNLSIDKIQNGSYDGSNVVASIAKLDARMDALASAISSIQIRMDTGALVGSIAGPMDTALGQRAIYAGRGIR